jgi:uncharacterized damage-inducible protein DinB
MTVSRTESVILAELVDKTRLMSMFYIDKLKGADLHKVFTADGIPLNSAFWIIAHMAVTQNGLLLRCTGSKGVKIPWAKQFNMGSGQSDPESSPAFEEVMAALNEVHAMSLEHIRSLDTSALDSLNPAGFEIMGEKTIRGMIIHFMRHEAGHAGQLSWLCKLHGIKTM